MINCSTTLRKFSSKGVSSYKVEVLVLEVLEPYRYKNMNKNLRKAMEKEKTKTKFPDKQKESKN